MFVSVKLYRLSQNLGVPGIMYFSEIHIIKPPPPPPKKKKKKTMHNNVCHFSLTINQVPRARICFVSRAFPRCAERMRSNKSRHRPYNSINDRQPKTNRNKNLMRPVAFELTASLKTGYHINCRESTPLTRLRDNFLKIFSSL